MGLEQYSTSELLAELKRRKSKDKAKPVKTVKKEKQYAELTGEVTHISKPAMGNKVKDYSFKVKFNDDELFSFERVHKFQNNYEYFAVDKSIKSVDELPALGDKVVVRSCIDNFFPPFVGTSWDKENVIIKVIKQ